MAASTGTEKTPAAGSGGFGLLEVLVATALMGLMLVVLLQVLTAALRSQETSFQRTRAALVADKILAENCRINTLKAGTYQGRDAGYDYLVRISPQEEWVNGVSHRAILCSLVEVTLTWQERGARKTLKLATLRTGAGRGG
jgi:Tfp pilus assembly protein PilV